MGICAPKTELQLEIWRQFYYLETQVYISITTYFCVGFKDKFFSNVWNIKDLQVYSK